MTRPYLSSLPIPPLRGRLAVAVLFLMGCGSENDPVALPPDTTLNVATEVRFSGLEAPVLVTHAPGDGRLFVVEQPGRIRRVTAAGELAREPYLDLTDLVGFGGERGLLSLAFHPDFVSNRHLFVSFTGQDGTSRLVRYTEAAGGDRADPASALQILSQPQPFPNHNGGHVAFGPDGLLYLGLGDGGSAGDPLDSGQDTGTWLGALLRLDVDRPEPGRAYGIPVDNPFVGDPTALDEIWAYGLRNPWRFAFDPVDNRLYVADVGQNTREEVSAVPVDPVGYNFGWRLKEGDRCFGQTPCDAPGLTDPVLAYDNPAEGCAVTGGVVYRGSAIPALTGVYLYSDFCAGWIRGFRLEAGEAREPRTLLEDVGRVTSFGTDASGEVYVLTAGGDVLQLVRR